MRIARHIIHLWVALAAAMVALFALRYAQADIPMVPPLIATNAYAAKRWSSMPSQPPSLC